MDTTKQQLKQHETPDPEHGLTRKADGPQVVSPDHQFHLKISSFGRGKHSKEQL